MGFYTFQTLFTLWPIFSQTSTENPENCNFSLQALFTFKPILPSGSVGLILFKPYLPSGRFSVRHRLSFRRACEVLIFLKPYSPSIRFSIRRRLKIRKTVTFFKQVRWVYPFRAPFAFKPIFSTPVCLQPENCSSFKRAFPCRSVLRSDSFRRFRFECFGAVSELCSA